MYRVEHSLFPSELTFSLVVGMDMMDDDEDEEDDDVEIEGEEDEIESVASASQTCSLRVKSIADHLLHLPFAASRMSSTSWRPVTTCPLRQTRG